MNPARLLTASVLFLVLLAPALFAATGTGASGLSPALADAPKGLVSVAWQAGQMTGIDGNVLLAIARVECDYRRCRTGQPDDLVPDDVRVRVDAAALQPGGGTAQLLGLADGRRIGDWVNPQPVGAEHAMGLMQFLHSTWRSEAAAAPGRPQDPYRPLDAMVTAGSYLHRLETGAAGRPGNRSHPSPPLQMPAPPCAPRRKHGRRLGGALAGIAASGSEAAARTPGRRPAETVTMGHRRSQLRHRDCQ